MSDIATPPGVTPNALRRVTADARGAALIEFALVALPFFALIIAVFQITLTFLAQQALETASDKAVRQILTGNAQKAGTTQAQFKASVCSKLPSFMKCANVLVDVQAASSFSSASTSQVVITYDGNGNPNNAFVYAPATAGKITVSRVMYVWSMQGGPLGFNLANMTRNRRLLTATSVFKTEEFS